jgi:putative membrane protein
MGMRAVLLTAAAALALAGCAESGGGFDPLTRSRGTENPGRYVDQAAANGLFEFQSAQLAVSRAQRADVRSYAQHLVDKQPVSSDHLATATAAAGLTLPAAALTSSQARQIAQLERASAEEFDEIYIRQQLSAQQTAIQIHNAFALAGDAPLLRPVAASGVSRAYQHYQEARRLQRTQS